MRNVIQRMRWEFIANMGRKPIRKIYSGKRITIQSTMRGVITKIEPLSHEKGGIDETLK